MVMLADFNSLGGKVTSAALSILMQDIASAFSCSNQQGRQPCQIDCSTSRQMSPDGFCRYQQRFGLLLAAFMVPGRQRFWHQDAPEMLQQARDPPTERCGVAAKSKPRRLSKRKCGRGR